MSNAPKCETCPQAATRVIRDHSRGWGNRQTPHRHICDTCYAALIERQQGDPLALEYPTLHTYPKEPAMTTDTSTLEQQLSPLAAEYAALAEQADAIKNRQEEIKAAIRDLAPGPDKYSAGALTITVSTNRRFDEKRALAMLPEAIAPLVTFPETRVDKDRLKVLAPDVFEASQETFAERVTIR